MPCVQPGQQARDADPAAEQEHAVAVQDGGRGAGAVGVRPVEQRHEQLTAGEVLCPRQSETTVHGIHIHIHVRMPVATARWAARMVGASFSAAKSALAQGPDLHFPYNLDAV